MPVNEVSAQWINEKIKTDAEGFILECENSYRSQVETVVKSVCEKSGNRLIMLAGPSSSGKTTTAGLMKMYIENFSRPSVVISLDDFYSEHIETLYFEDGTPDYETISALDIDYIIECLTSLVRKGECRLPRFSFQTKKRHAELVETKIEKDTVIIVEGLHAINQRITKHLDEASFLKAYVSVSTRIMNDEGVLFTKRDLRFIRRMIRDYHHRNAPVDFTFSLWNGVRMGEDRYLFPFSHLADVRIDSIHYYEPCLFKNEAVRLLDHIDKDSVYYHKAKTFGEKFDYFQSLDVSKIPQNSLLHEFIG